MRGGGQVAWGEEPEGWLAEPASEEVGPQSSLPPTAPRPAPCPQCSQFPRGPSNDQGP